MRDYNRGTSNSVIRRLATQDPEQVVAKVSQLRRQRDDLLEALEGIYEAFDSCVELRPELLWKARLAITKAKEGQ